MSSSYVVKSIDSVKSTVVATVVSLIIMYVVHYLFRGIAICLMDQTNKRVKQKLAETSRVLYLFIIASIVSIYPPFYYGTHSTVCSYLTLVIVIMLHIFCWYSQRNWAKLNMIYHLFIAIWITLVLIMGIIKSNQQTAMVGE